MAPEALGRLDAAIGDGLESLIRAHHRRRLEKLGWGHIFGPPGGWWAGGEPPPRQGNSVRVLIDGGEAMPRIAEALRRARSHVHIAGWHTSPHFSLVREPTPTQVKQLLDELARKVKVRVLLWAGAPLPHPFRPNRNDMKALSESLAAQSAIEVALDSRERPLHCHHEKVVIVDDEVAFVGGMDLTTLSGDRYDTSEHPMRGDIGWHDLMTELRGPVVSDVAEHFAMRWREVTDEEVPFTTSVDRAGDVEAQIVRTVPEKIYASVPRGDFRILETYRNALQRAERLVYIENQFLWSSEVVTILAEKLRDPPSDEFRLVLLLPVKAATGNDDTLGQLAVLADADQGQGRFVASTLYARSGSEQRPVYVHAKIGIVDDYWMTIGSANLNNHSLFNDSEMNVVVCDESLASETRSRLWAEHLEVDVSQVQGDTTRVVDEMWKPIAQEQLELKDAGRPLTHRLARLPHVSRRAKRLVGPLQTLVVDA